MFFFFNGNPDHLEESSLYTCRWSQAVEEDEEATMYLFMYLPIKSSLSTEYCRLL